LLKGLRHPSPCLEGIEGEKRYIILNVGTRGRLMVNFTSQPIYPGKEAGSN
jgi:hypothetical protein